MDQEFIGKGFHVLAKPIGPLCNLDCQYCFYSEKKSLFSWKKDFRMPDEVLEEFIRKYISSQDVPEIEFVWQGGEPVLTGLDFYRKVIRLQNQYAAGKIINNCLQTNGTLLDDEWCSFLKRHNFLVGLSLDGPENLHDLYRSLPIGKGSWDKTMHGLSLLKKHGVSFNVLACVTNESSKHPVEIYRFLKEICNYIQFTPVVERLPGDKDRMAGLRHARHGGYPNNPALASYSVNSEAYGDFLIQIFDEWVKEDVGSVFVMNFEWALEAWLGLPSTVCIFSRRCGRTAAIEHNGDIYSCDHFVYPEYCLGNIITGSPKDMIHSPPQVEFGKVKEALPKYCMDCEVRFACNGECPKNRFLITEDDEPGLNYLCAGYKKYFRHIHRYMKVMVQLIENGLPVSNVKNVIKGPLVFMNKN